MAAQVIVDLFLSVDGWAGGDRLPGFFGYAGPDLGAWIADEQAVPETVLLGRRTYETFASLPREAWEEDRAHLMAVRKIVASRTLTTVPWPNTTIAADLVRDIARVKAETPDRIRTWGSISLAGQLLSAGLVDRVRLMRFPLLAGELGRRPGFSGMPSAELELVDHRVLDARILLEEYRPTGAGIPRA